MFIATDKKDIVTSMLEFGVELAFEQVGGGASASDVLALARVRLDDLIVTEVRL